MSRKGSHYHLTHKRKKPHYTHKRRHYHLHHKRKKAHYTHKRRHYHLKHKRAFRHVHRKTGYHVHRKKGYHVHRRSGYHIHRRRTMSHTLRHLSHLQHLSRHRTRHRLVAGERKHPHTRSVLHKVYTRRHWLANHHTIHHHTTRARVLKLHNAVYRNHPTSATRRPYP